jgi:hypothetical protein
LKETSLLKSQSSPLRLFLAAAILALIAGAVRAQDPFEIQVYLFRERMLHP